jgi:NAD(P)-dependent dehydrogenase (short-subunit alcohol dehydrogenase family)
MNDDVERDSKRLRGKCALVTGGSRGIGLAVVRRLVDEGARVLFTGRHEDALAEARAGLPEGYAVTVSGKADDPEHIRAVVERIAAEFGALDILVANAGINPVYGPLLDLDLAAARKVLDVNVIATLAWAQAAVKHEVLRFRERNGSIIIVSSVTGQTPSPGIGWYGVSKAANAHLTRTLAVELGPDIRVNAVAPAVVKTRFAEALYEGREAEVAADYPLNRLGEPLDVAGAVAFLASSDAAWMTGQVLNVDGGLLVKGGHA